MDLLTFGFVALPVAIVGFFTSLILGLREAVARSQERRYIARTARRAVGRSRSTA